MPQKHTEGNEHESQRIVLSERDSLLFADLLENPPEPNEKLTAAAYALPEFVGDTEPKSAADIEPKAVAEPKPW